MEIVPLSVLQLLGVQLLLYLPSKIILVAAGLRLFDLYSRAGYCAVASLCFLLHFMFAMNRPYLASLAALLLAVAVPLLLFARDGLPRRVFTVLVVMVVVVLAQIFPSLIWDDVTASSPYDPASVSMHLGYSVFVRVVQLCVLSLLLAGVVEAERRITRNRSDQGVFSFVWFLIMQLILACLIVLLIELTGTPREQVVVGAELIVVLFVAVDALYLVLLDRYNRSLAEFHRAEVLQRELDQYLKNYEEIERKVAETAHLRHDMRNQLNVIAALVDQGNVEQARRHLAFIIERVAKLDAGRGGASEFRVEGRGDLVAKQASAGSARGSFAREGAGFSSEAASPGEDSSAFASSKESDASLSARLAGDCKSSGGGVFMRRPDPSAVLHRFLEFLFPASQILPLLLLLAAAYGSPRYEVVVFVCLAAALLCVAADIALFKAFAVARRKEFVSERIRLLDEQRTLRKQHYDRLAGELQEIKGVRAAMMARLCELDDKLASGALEDASVQLCEAVGVFGPLDERFCENKAANALISMKARTCREAGFELESYISLPEGLPVPDVDLCIALSNLLDNAINGCRKLESGVRRISLKSCVSPGILVIEVTNSCLVEPSSGFSSKAKSELLRREGSPLREHGWGLLILEDLAQRYDGSFETSCSEGVFRATVVLSLADAVESRA